MIRHAQTTAVSRLATWLLAARRAGRDRPHRRRRLQGRGLGTELLARLSDRAREEGIGRFTAAVSADNVPMGMLLRSVGAVETGRAFGVVAYEISLGRAGEYSLEWWFRRVEDGSVFSWR